MISVSSGSGYADSSSSPSPPLLADPPLHLSYCNWPSCSGVAYPCHYWEDQHHQQLHQG
ncbi:hypothetical protein Scep_022432 [Stephania cephalantha]|uniref:Uncharacterized protein n=1 Tax=Stephania cephalantha TaxID=152367 RepID=A0AAP0FAF2_9MAGN